MVDFNEYKKKMQKRNERSLLLEKLAQIDMELIESNIPEFHGNIEYQILEKLREEEFAKLRKISSKINKEAKSILENWKKDNVCFLK